ncbi:hypothetical protein AB0945_21290 [Streptomyces sp. NPDC005474]|uniref:hypothetical protein n=1 Tax=Streptomyces sp. NPDC005474 TaxID=3154878 RepID=UPI003451F676
MYGLPWEWTTQGFYRMVWAQYGVAVIVLWWLSWLVMARTPLSQVTPARRLLQRGAAVLGGAAAVYATAPFPSVLARFFGQSVYACVLAWLALEVCRRHGVPLDLARPRTAVERLRDWDITQWVFSTCVAGGCLTFLLVQLVHWTKIDVPVMPGGQMSSLGIDNPGILVIGVVATVAIEDVVIVAATTALLTAVRRPAWQIYTLVCVPEVLLHAYFGLPAIGMILFAAGRVWLYRQYGRLMPFLIAHFVFDVVGGFLQLSPVPLLYRPVLALPFGAAVVWIGQRLTKAAHPSCPETHAQPVAPDGDSPQHTDRPDPVSLR